MLCCTVWRSGTHTPAVSSLTAGARTHFRRTADGKVEAVELTQDHRPDLEQNNGSSRLAGEELYWEEGVAYLNREGDGGGGQEVQRLAVSRSLGDFDLTGNTCCFVPHSFAGITRVKSEQVWSSASTKQGEIWWLRLLSRLGLFMASCLYIAWLECFTQASSNHCHSSI